MVDVATVFQCFSNSGLGTVECIMGQTFLSMWGGMLPLIGLVVMVLINFLLFRLRISMELIVVANVTLVGILALALLPDWVMKAVVIIIMFLVGFGFYKLFRR